MGKIRPKLPLKNVNAGNTNKIG